MGPMARRVLRAPTSDLEKFVVSLAIVKRRHSGGRNPFLVPAMQRALPVAMLLLFSCALKLTNHRTGTAHESRSAMFTGASRSTPNASYKQRRRAQLL